MKCYIVSTEMVSQGEFKDNVAINVLTKFFANQLNTFEDKGIKMFGNQDCIKAHFLLDDMLCRFI